LAVLDIDRGVGTALDRQACPSTGIHPKSLSAAGSTDDWLVGNSAKLKGAPVSCIPGVELLGGNGTLGLLPESHFVVLFNRAIDVLQIWDLALNRSTRCQAHVDTCRYPKHHQMQELNG
jgi:hypothetical protein